MAGGRRAERSVCFISETFDSRSHFEKDVDDMLSLYERVTGEKLDMAISADTVEGTIDKRGGGIGRWGCVGGAKSFSVLRCEGKGKLGVQVY